MGTIGEHLKSHRIVSLAGSGKCGKTRLAGELVTELDHDSEEGIWFVDLAPVEAGALLVKEIMDTLNIPESPGEDMAETLVRKIRDMNMLIILDKIVSKGHAKKESKARILSGYSWSQVAVFNQHSKAIDLLKHSLTIWRRLDNQDEEAIVLAAIALFHHGSMDDENGIKYARKAYEIAEIGKDPGVLLYGMVPVSQGLVNLKEFDEAGLMAREICEAKEKLNNLYAQFTGNHHQADRALMEGKFHESERKHAAGLQKTRSYNDMFYTCIEMTGLAMSVAGMGRSAKALRLMGAVDEIAEKGGIMSPDKFRLQFWQERLKIHISGTREKLGKELTRNCESEGRTMDLDRAIQYAFDFEKD
jgi:hypothetical protein